MHENGRFYPSHPKDLPPDKRPGEYILCTRIKKGKRDIGYVPLPTAASMSICSTIVKHLIRRQQEVHVKINCEAIWITSRVLDVLFDAILDAIAKHQMTRSWQHRSFNDLMVAIWYGFPPTAEGAEHAEAFFGREGTMFSWDGRPGPATATSQSACLPLGHLHVFISSNLDWTIWASHYALAFGSRPGITLLDWVYPFYAIEQAVDAVVDKSQQASSRVLLNTEDDSLDMGSDDLPAPSVQERTSFTESPRTAIVGIEQDTISSKMSASSHAVDIDMELELELIVAGATVQPSEPPDDDFGVWTNGVSQPLTSSHSLDRADVDSPADLPSPEYWPNEDDTDFVQELAAVLSDVENGLDTATAALPAQDTDEDMDPEDGDAATVITPLNSPEDPSGKQIPWNGAPVKGHSLFTICACVCADGTSA
jgi:hypothetical protein